MKRHLGWACVLALGAANANAQDPKEALRRRLKDDLVGKWIYDDINAGFSEAKKTGKPMLVVFR